MGQLLPLRLHARNSLTSPPFPPASVDLPTPPSKLRDRRRPGPVPDLICPCTQASWREALEEVRVFYVKRQFRQCAARCRQLLESIQVSVSLTLTNLIPRLTLLKEYPLYQIYLSFFAASSLETQSRSLHLCSPAKITLLRQALTYYQTAESHTDCASFAMNPTHMYAVQESRRSSDSSTRSSIQSTRDSILSLTSSPSSVGNSPVRSTTPSTFATFPSPSSSISARSPLSPTRFATSPSSPPSHLLPRSQSRLRGHLSDLHTQLLYHIRSVETQIEDLQQSRPPMRSALRTLHLFAGLDVSKDDVEDEAMRKAALRARVQQSRGAGWKRRRFDGRRYEELCERAMAELEG